MLIKVCNINTPWPIKNVHAISYPNKMARSEVLQWLLIWHYNMILHYSLLLQNVGHFLGAVFPWQWLLPKTGN